MYEDEATMSTSCRLSSLRRTMRLQRRWQRCCSPATCWHTTAPQLQQAAAPAAATALQQHRTAQLKPPPVRVAVAACSAPVPKQHRRSAAWSSACRRGRLPKQSRRTRRSSVPGTGTWQHCCRGCCRATARRRCRRMRPCRSRRVAAAAAVTRASRLSHPSPKARYEPLSSEFSNRSGAL